MTDRIPEEIKREAQILARFVLAGVPFKNSDEIERQVQATFPKVARALMARDQRAAEIARTDGHDPEAGEWIASLILSYDEAQK